MSSSSSAPSRKRLRIDHQEPSNAHAATSQDHHTRPASSRTTSPPRLKLPQHGQSGADPIDGDASSAPAASTDEDQGEEDDDEEEEEAEEDGDGTPPTNNQQSRHRKRTNGTTASPSTAPRTAAAAAAAEAQNKKISCLVCRDAKVKCVPATDGESCVRCSKLGKECVFRTHKRGRKPGKIKSQQIQRRLELLQRTLIEIEELNQDVRDPDAESLVKTLTWQLHRSKFFSKGCKPEWNRKQSPSPAGPRPPNAQGRGGLDGDGGTREAASADGTAATADAGTGRGRSGGSRHAPVAPQRLRSGSFCCHRDHDHRSASPAGLSLLRPLLDASATRPKSDFNMLVDFEDRASVARVDDEIRTLSNPLKLLAQASSDDQRFRDGGSGGRSALEEAVSGGDRHRQGLRSAHGLPEAGNDRGAADVASGKDGKGRKGKGARQTATADDKFAVDGSDADGDKDRRAQDWASTYFSRGAFHPVYDNRPEFDPVDIGLLTADQAERLVESFYAEIGGTYVHIFDPHLSTVAYVRKHSAFLLTVLCATAAEFGSDGGAGGDGRALAAALRRHVDDMMPAIMCGDYKNVEMAQAFLVLAAYQPMSHSAMADQTWAYLGTAIRIATELGCNLCCYSFSTPAVHKQEHYQRQLRNTERLWLNIWIFEKTLASQTGQRFHLSEDGVITMCSSWHRQQYALPQDETLVAFVELRRIMAIHSDHFNTHILRSLTARLGPMRTDADSGGAGGLLDKDGKEKLGSASSGAAAGIDSGSGNGTGSSSQPATPALSHEETQHLVLQLEFFRNSVRMDMKRWEDRWLSGSVSQSSSTSENPTPLQIIGPLYLDYAALVTYSLPLPIRYTVDVSEQISLLYRHCYSSATGYMSVFAERSQRGYMSRIPNTSIVSAVYCAVFALDLCRRASHLPFVQPHQVADQARRIAKVLHEISEAPINRSPTLLERTAAKKYAEFLEGVLDRVDWIVVPSSVATAPDGGGGGGFGPRDDSTGLTHLPEPRSSTTTNATTATQAGASSDSGSAFEAFGGEVGQPSHLAAPFPNSHPGSVVAASVTASARTGRLGGQATTASQRYSSNMHFHPGLIGGTGGMAAGFAAHPQQQQQQQQQHEMFAPHQAQMQGLGNGNVEGIGMGTGAVPGGSGQNAGPGQGGQEGLDKHWAWMMSDLDFFALDGGDPIMDQMGRLFG